MNYSTAGSTNFSGGRFPLFVCGMHNTGVAECDSLANHAIPDLSERCARQRLSLAANDVRTIAAHQPHRDLVGACIDDIRDRQCYVVGVIGAVADTLVNGAEDSRRYPWLTPENGAHLRTAELDVLESVSTNPLLGNHCFIYLQESLHHKHISTILPAGRETRLKRLLQNLTTSVATVRTYSNAAHLCSLLCNDIGVLVDTVGVRDDTDAFVTSERAAHRAFAESRRAVYVPIGDYAERISKLMSQQNTAGRRIAIVGQSGAGKSAFLAHWSSIIRNERQKAVVIEHYVSASPHGADETTLLRHVLTQLHTACSINDAVPTELDDMINALLTWPAQAEGREVIMVLDGVDRLIESVRGPEWLSAQTLPANLVLVVSTQPRGAAYAEIEEPLWTLIEMAPLTMEDRWRLLDSYLERGAGRLPEWLKNQVSQADTITTPLIMRGVIEGLSIEGALADLESRLQELLSAPSIEALFNTILNWLEAHAAFGRELVEEVLCLLRTSHHGLSMDELADLLDPARLRNPRRNDDSERTLAVMALVRRLGTFIIPCNGLLMFFHDSLGDTVEQRYMKTFGLRRRRHEKLAKYFSEHGSATRHVQETPWQWNAAKRWTELKKCIVDIPMFISLSTEDHRWDLLGYWQSMKSVKANGSLADAYLESLRKLDPAPLLEDIVRLVQRLGEMFLYAAEHDAAITVLQRALPYAGTNALAIRTHVLLSAAHHQRGEFADAERFLEPFAQRSALDPDEQAVLLEAMERLANLYCARHAYGDAERVLNRALPLSAELHGRDHPQTLSIITLMGLVAIRNGSFYAAEHMLRPVLDTCRRLYTLPHPATAAALNNLAAALQKQERWAEAMTLVKESVAINEKIYPTGHPETAYKLNNLAYMLRLDGQFDQSEDVYLRVLKILTIVFDNHHPEVAGCHNNLGTLYTFMKRFDDAENSFMKALEIYLLKFGRDNTRVISVELNRAWLRMQRGDYLESAQLFARLTRQKIAVSGVNHPETQRAIDNFRKAVACARLQNPQNPDVLDVELNLGTLEMELENHTQAATMFGDIIPRLKKILGADHSQTLLAIEQYEKARAAGECDAGLSGSEDEPGR